MPRQHTVHGETRVVREPISLVVAAAVPDLAPPARPLPEGHAVTNAPANQTETSKLTQATYDRLVAEL